MTQNVQDAIEWLKQAGAMCGDCEDCKRKAQTVSILSIDAWRDGEGWTWNNWFKVGEITIGQLDTLKSNREICAYMRREGFLSAHSAGKVAIEDDQYNIVICERATLMPVFAIAYGEVY